MTEQNNDRLIDLNFLTKLKIKKSLKSFELSRTIVKCCFGFLMIGSYIGWTINYNDFFERIKFFPYQNFAYIAPTLALGASFGPIFAYQMHRICNKIFSTTFVFCCLMMIIGWLITFLNFFNDENIFWVLLTTRFFIGCCIGMIYYLIPIYIFKIVPENLRIMVDHTFAALIAVGVLLQYCLEYAKMSQYSSLVALGTTVVFLLSSLTLPQLPIVRINSENSSEAATISDSGSIVKLINRKAGPDYEEIINFDSIISVICFAGIVQLIGGLSYFFYMPNVFNHIELDITPVEFAIIMISIIIISVPMSYIFSQCMNEKAILVFSTVAIFLISGSFSYFLYFQKTRVAPMNIGYVPIILYSLYTFFYGIGPYTTILNYLHAVSNERNYFTIRMIFTSTIWFGIFIMVFVLPTMLNLVGHAYYFIINTIVCFICMVYVIVFIPRIKSTVIEINNMENQEKLSIDESLQSSSFK